MTLRRRLPLIFLIVAPLILLQAGSQHKIGREVAIQRHLGDDEEFRIPVQDLVEYGKRIFCANWTDQEGAGRPLTKGTGKAISDPSAPLVGSRSWNRISGPDANSCAGCHNQPFGIPGGSGDFATSVFVLGQRFDFVTFDSHDKLPTRGAIDESAHPATLNDIATSVLRLVCLALATWRCLLVRLRKTFREFETV